MQRWAWKPPSRPVIPWIRTRVEELTRMLMGPPEERGQGSWVKGQGRRCDVLDEIVTYAALGLTGARHFVLHGPDEPKQEPTAFRAKSVGVLQRLLRQDT